MTKPSVKITAELNYLRISPRKVRAVINAIRGKRVPEAEATLRFLGRRAASPLAKLVHSAVASARHNYQITSPEDLVITDVIVGSGPTLKRSRPRAFGRAFAIRKRTSHVRLVLEAAGRTAQRRKGARPNYEIVRAEAAPAEGPEARRRTSPEREAFRARPKAGRSADFVRRMFRRKAI
jgi:large subunit ribosomal protein L22